MSVSSAFACMACGRVYPLDSRDWRCSCGGFFAFKDRPHFDVEWIECTGPGMWRYRKLLPLDPAWAPVTLGEGNTPLIPIEWQGRHLHLKLESIAPTGSFKDRGAAVLVTALHGLGIERVVEDSSGNAGASLAAYTGRAGIGCEICVPNTASGAKLAQMAAYGAEVIEIRGKREYAALAAWAAAAHGAYYASHVYNPYFLAGTETVAYELWEQMDGRAPEAVILPVGNGTLLLGVYQGFCRLQEAGLIDRLPVLYAVQASACAPIYRAFCQGDTAVEPVLPCSTAATGIAISKPIRGGQILAAIRATGGAVLAVSEEETEQARNQLSRQGFYVERTSAVAVAAVADMAGSASRPEEMVVLLTGHGLKT